jgi:hypothetical protein
MKYGLDATFASPRFTTSIARLTRSVQTSERRPEIFLSNNNLTCRKLMAEYRMLRSFAREPQPSGVVLKRSE